MDANIIKLIFVVAALFLGYSGDLLDTLGMADDATMDQLFTDIEKVMEYITGKPFP